MQVDEPEHHPTVSDQMVQVMTDWGVDTVFGMVGHSNLGFADAMRRAEEAGKLRYFGVRHEGAAAFARLCGGEGFRATTPAEVAPAIAAGLAATGTAIVEILTDPMET